MTMQASPAPHHQAQPGDWVRVHGLPGQSGREGQILEVLGRHGHEHDRVRWDEQPETGCATTLAS
jgi:Domain of unknown function (DUF1918)